MTDPFDRVRKPHPTADRPIQSGDIVVNAAGWPGRLAVVDINASAGTAELVAPGGVRILARLSDLVRINEAAA